MNAPRSSDVPCVLENGRVRLRQHRLEDAEKITGWLNQPRVTKNMNLPKITEEGVRSHIRAILSGDSTTKTDRVPFVIELVRENVAVGLCWLQKIDWKNRNAKFDTIIGETGRLSQWCWREAIGLLTEYAFRNLDLVRLSTGVYEFNSVCVNMLRKLGFEQEGVERASVLRDGRFWDTLLFAKIREGMRKGSGEGRP